MMRLVSMRFAFALLFLPLVTVLPAAAATLNVVLTNENTFAGSTVAVGDVFTGTIDVATFDGLPNTRHPVTGFDITTSDGQGGTVNFNPLDAPIVNGIGGPAIALLQTDDSGDPEAVVPEVPETALGNMNYIRTAIPAINPGDNTYSLAFNTGGTDTLGTFILFRSELDDSFRLGPNMVVALGTYELSVPVSAIPVPATLPLLASVLFGLAFFRRKRTSAA
ncbi:MAG: PEP-CTERM sorting domain-containing protein [Pseudomonadota bacterium]